MFLLVILQFLILGNNFGVGRGNTNFLVSGWNLLEDSKQYDRDLWNVIQDVNVNSKYDLSKWFLPSRSELSAFLDSCDKIIGCDKDNFSDFGLSSFYWTCSPQDPYHSWCAWMMVGSFVDEDDWEPKWFASVRMTTTF